MRARRFKSQPASRAAGGRSGSRRLGRALVIVLLALLVVASLAGAAGALYVHASLPQATGLLTVPGLSQPVNVVRDRYGVPSISAADEHDLFLAQGYVTAQDRLFQMELDRHIAAGRLTELFGRGSKDSLLHTDELLRTLDLYESAQDEYNIDDDTTRQELNAYAEGVNAFLRANQHSLPVELAVIGDQPQPWTALDSLAYGRVVALSLDSNWQQKYTRALLIGKLGVPAVDALYPPYPAFNPTLIARDGSAAPLNPPTQQRASTSGSTLNSLASALTSRMAQAFVALPTDGLMRADALDSLLSGIVDSIGSNDWVVDGTVTSTHKPLLANDPHLGISEPAVWYEVSLRSPAVNVQGFSFPGVPGVIIGHNAYISWGVTNVDADNTDLYVEHLDPVGHPNEYLYQGQWLPLGIRHETFKIAGSSQAVTLTVRTTGDGPIINDVVSSLSGSSTLLSLKWTALQPGYRFAGFFELDRATDWKSFQAALADISISQNFVYADTLGNIGYQMSGCLPIRPAENDSLPVDGSSGAYAWQGCVPFSQLPSLYDPPTHIIATANNQIVPDSYPIYVSDQWDRGFRARRILDLLQASSSLTVADFERIQNDVYSEPAALLVPLITAAAPQAAGSSVLVGWDDQLTRTSSAAAIYEATLGYLTRDLLEPVLGPSLYRTYQANTSASNITLALYELLKQPSAPYLTSSAVDPLIIKALGQAMGQLTASQGSDPSKWQWGTLHTAHFAHPLSGTWPLSLAYGVAPLPRPGDSMTVDQGGAGGVTADPADYSQHSIPSMREIVDLSNFDSSEWVIPMGESGQPFSGHYADLLPFWDRGRYQPMVFSPDAIGQAAVDVLTLQP
jgi:penicillin G amidase